MTSVSLERATSVCVLVQGGVVSEQNYPYCSGFGKCFPCEAPGYNKTRCGPPAPYCLKNESCSARLNRSQFVPGLKLKSWVAIDKVKNIAYHINGLYLVIWCRMKVSLSRSW